MSDTKFEAMRRDGVRVVLTGDALAIEYVKELAAEVEKYKRWFELKSESAGKTLADLSTANLKIEQLTEVLKWIAQQRYTKRDTIHPGNAFEKAGELNQKLIAIMDRAADALRAVPDETPTLEG